MDPGPTVITGWYSQPNVRGTLDIVYGCLATLGLCSWSCLCLNIPNPDTTNAGVLLVRLRWQLFTIIFPEVTVAIAAEQWESANQSVEKFKELGYEHLWSRRHAFFADMGGIHLQAPAFPPFPVDSQQLSYLVERGYLEMPQITHREIADKNKADGLARSLAITQITWFTLQCIGRGIQGLGLSTLELSTLASILCTLNVYFFWYDKPYDVRSPFTLHTEYTIQTILVNAGERASRPYKRTPLEFVNPPPDDKSIVAPFWFGVDSIFHVPEDPGHRPIRCFSNNKTMPPKGLTPRERLYGILIEFGFFGIHFLGVLLEFPSTEERYLWIAASSTLVALLVLYLVAVYIGHKYQARVGLWLFQKESGSVLEVIEMFPRWAKVAIHGPVVLFYVLARFYILVEGFVGLRSLPAKLYTTVEWAGFLPHI